jgi:hypothetical protein
MSLQWLGSARDQQIPVAPRPALPDVTFRAWNVGEYRSVIGGFPESSFVDSMFADFHRCTSVALTSRSWGRRLADIAWQSSNPSAPGARVWQLTRIERSEGAGI